jgi:Mg-chelatase subunit ChlD
MPQINMQLTDIQTSGPIQNIESPSHPAMSIRSHSSRHGKESRRRKIVKYNSATYLDRDFILVIHAHDAGSPHCFAEMRYESKRKDACTLALQLVLTPKLEIPSHPQEYIFVIDRSGSMEGQPIETAKKTLAILLSLLPQNGSKFGIIAFDHALNILWEKSREYSESTRDEAVSFSNP